MKAKKIGLPILSVHSRFEKNLERKERMERKTKKDPRKNLTVTAAASALTLMERADSLPQGALFFTAVIERDGEWYIAFCPEIPEANGQGKTKEEARKSLADGIALLFEDRREDGLSNLSPGAIQERVVLS